MIGAVRDELAAKLGNSSDAIGLAQQLTRQNPSWTCRLPQTNESETGYRCRGHVPGYSQPVNIFIPANYSKQKPVSMAYHIHGWWETRSDSNAWCDRPETYHPFCPPQGEFARWSAKAQTNTLVIAPESGGRNTDHLALKNSDSLAAFFIGVDKLLGAGGGTLTTSTKRAVSGHSGAYTIMGAWGEFVRSAQVPQMQNVKAVGFFDSLYGLPQGIEGWRTPGSSRIVYMSYNPRDSQVKKASNEHLRKVLCPSDNCPGVISKANPGAAHMLMMQRDYTDFLVQAFK